MRAYVYLFGAVMPLTLSACGSNAAPPTPTAKHSIVGRYQFAGKREYDNGTEVYYLDTVKGRVCYGFITNNEKPDSNTCTQSMAEIDGDD